MSDVKWYYEQPPAPMDVSLWHPYSSPPIVRKGGWNFGASPTDLLNIGKYLFGGGLKDLLGLGAKATGAGVAGAGAGAIGSGTLDLGDLGGAAPSAIDTLANTYAGGAPGGLDAISGVPVVASGFTPGALSASGTAGAGAGVSGGFSGTVGGAGLGTAAAFAAPIALALASMFSGGHLFGKKYDPMEAVRAQFGSENPTLEALRSYFTEPESRVVPLMDTLAGLSQLGYNRDALSTLASEGLWDPRAGRWTNIASSIVAPREGPRSYSEADYNKWVANKDIEPVHNPWNLEEATYGY